MTTKVLCIDDDRMTTRLISKLLKPMGYEVVEAHEPLLGMKMALADTPNLILADYDMPDMNGIDLVRTLKANLHIKHIPVIMLTAHDSPELEQQALKAGCEAFITKPLTKYAVLRTIAQFRYPTSD